MSGNDRVVESFERAAEVAGDITPAVYEHFYLRCPAAREVTAHLDPHMKGRMLEEVIELLLQPPDAIDDAQLAFETSNHRSYGTDPSHYRPLLEAVRDSLREALGAEWSSEVDAAWTHRIEALTARILAHT